MRKIKIELLIIIGVILVTTIPFINKAFHIDDWAFINIAQNIKVFLLQPYSWTIGGEEGEEIYAFGGIPPVVPCFLALVIAVTKTVTESILHISFLLFPLIAGVSMYFLARRFTRYPLYVSLFFVSTPVFIVCSHSIMTDMPMLSLYLVSMVTYIYGIDNDNKGLLILSSIIICLASLTRLVALSLLPFLFIYSIVNKRSIRRSIYVMLPTIIVFLLWFLQNQLSYGRIFIFTWADYHFSHKYINVFNLFLKLISNITGIGGAMAFPLFLFPIFAKGKKESITYSLVFLVSILIVISPITTSYTIIQKILFMVFLSTGLFVTYNVFEKGLKPLFLHQEKPSNGIAVHSDNLFLFFWYGGILITSSIILTFGCARYMLPLLPALIIIFINQADRAFVKKKYFRIFCIAGIIFTLVTGVTVAAADYEYAGIYKTFAESVRDKYKTGFNKIWFVGTWGFRYYMEREGCHYLFRDDNSPAKGDIIVIPRLPCPYVIDSRVVTRSVLVDTKSYPGKLPVRVLNREVHAGFWSDGWGFLPYAISHEKLDYFDIYEVRESK